MGPAVDDVQLLAGHGAAPPDDSGGIYDWDAAAAAPWNMAEAQAALAMVTEAMDELWPDDRWIGKRNREDLTEPVRRLRASAQRVGLLRVSRGQLLPTKIGTALRDDPPAMFRHLAERLAGRPRDGFARMANPLVLLSVAAGRSHREPVAKLLTAAGWSARGGGAVSPYAPGHAASDAVYVLDCAGAWPEIDWRTEEVTTAGRALAHAALVLAR